MRFYYADKTPLRVLDEIEFWKQQESEHTVVIRQVVTNLESHFVEQLENWQLAFTEAEGNAVRYIEAVIRSKEVISPELLDEIIQFTKAAKDQSGAFVDFLNLLAATSDAVKSNPVAGTVINHIRRESEYLRGILIAALKHL